MPGLALNILRSATPDGPRSGGLETISPGSRSVWLGQVLTATLQNNTTYTLSALVARPLNTAPPGQAFFNYSLQLYAGTTLLSSAANLIHMPPDSSARDSLAYSSGANNPLAGQPLGIVLATSGPEGVYTIAFFDDITLSAATSAAPSVSAVVSASAFGGFSAASPGSWVEIYGSNLASDTRSWAGTDFNNGTAPTSLDGTRVTIGGKDAFIDYISPGQVNALLPSDTPTGSQQLIVTGPSGASTAYPIRINQTEPGLLAPASFNISGSQYVFALHPDGTYVLPTNAISGVNSRPAKPGEVLTLYGVGFGPVTPVSDAGQIVTQDNSLSSNLRLTIGGTSTTLTYDGLAPNYTGLYQFNVTVPNIPAGNAAIAFVLGGAAGAQTLFLSVAN